mgnify:CR=1 FL=1
MAFGKFWTISDQKLKRPSQNRPLTKHFKQISKQKTSDIEYCCRANSETGLVGDVAPPPLFYELKGNTDETK